jgi:hypothetical protein
MLSPSYRVEDTPKLSHDLPIRMPLVPIDLAYRQRLCGRWHFARTRISVTFQSFTAGFDGSLLHWKYSPLTDTSISQMTETADFDFVLR